MLGVLDLRVVFISHDTDLTYHTLPSQFIELDDMMLHAIDR